MAYSWYWDTYIDYHAVLMVYQNNLLAKGNKYKCNITEIKQNIADNPLPVFTMLVSST